MAWNGTLPIWAQKAFSEFRQLHKDWNCKLFNRFDMEDSFPLKKYLGSFPDYAFFDADIFRYYLIYKFGGIWVDCDTRPIKSLEPLIKSGKSFIVKTRPRGTNLVERSILDNYLMGGPKGSKFIEEIIEKFEGNEIVNNKPRDCYSLAMFKLFKNDKPKYADLLEVSDTEEANTNDVEDFFDGKFEKIHPFNSNSFLRHYRHNFYKNYKIDCEYGDKGKPL
jgi:hypothetical protein